jgi:predicted transcriptional regulator
MSQVTDIQILLSMYKSDICPSIHELREATGKSVAHIHERLEYLEGKGMINPPPKKNMARARTLTEMGKSYLRENGYIPTEVFDPYGR